MVARICFGKAAFDILDINAVQMTFINLLWLWKCSYFNQHWGVLCAVWTLMWIAEYFWWRDDLIKIKKKKKIRERISSGFEFIFHGTLSSKGVFVSICWLVESVILVTLDLCFSRIKNIVIHGFAKTFSICLFMPESELPAKYLYRCIIWRCVIY